MRLQPGARASPIVEANRLLVAAARSGDARLAARAEHILARLPHARSSPAILRSRAFAAQHRHDFKLAGALLDRLIQLQPRDGDARLSRAQIHLVHGRLDLARKDCAALALGVDAGRGLACVSALTLRTGDLLAAASVNDDWLRQAKPADPLRPYMLLMRAEIASRARAEDADRRFDLATAAAPHDARVLAARARHLRRNQRHAEVLVLLPADTANDGLQLQRVLAAAAVGSPRAALLIDAQQRRYELARQLGSEPELRDEAEFYLSLRRDARRALQLAERNFAEQRDSEDVDLMQRAAMAAGRPEALAPVLAWGRAQGIATPAAAGEAR